MDGIPIDLPDNQDELLCAVEVSTATCELFCAEPIDPVQLDCPNLEPLPEMDSCLSPADLAPSYGVGSFDTIDAFLALARFFPNETLGTAPFHAVKFVVGIHQGEGAVEYPVYFINTPCFRNHGRFTLAIGCTGANRFFGQVVGSVYYSPTSDGAGTFLFGVENSAGTQEEVTIAYEHLRDTIPFASNLAYVAVLEDQVALARAFIDPPFEIVEQIETQTYRLLNPGQSFGRLHVAAEGDVPQPSDIVVYQALPNDVPQVAGIITTVPQTPLAHANLRAVQSGVPNAFIQDISSFEDLVGQFVYYEAGPAGPIIRPANEEEVEGYRVAARGAETLSPIVDLSVRQIRSLDDVAFTDYRTFGSKAAGVAELRRLGIPTVSHGFAVPFYFYDAFMRYNGFYDELDALAGGDTVVDEGVLHAFRDRIRNGEMPTWMIDALTVVQSEFDGGIRCRSSASGEDTLEQSGAGLYDSYTHHQPEEGHLSKSIKQVYASLFTYRAYTYREFYGIRHRDVAMGVLLHPNFDDEQVNGVAVAYDMLYGYGNDIFYINALQGEDLVTNPMAGADALEIAIMADTNSDAYIVAGGSIDPTGLAGVPLELNHAFELRDHLAVMQDHFRVLYGSPTPFAIEVEFKVTSAGVLVIKQARPWVFADPGLPQWSDSICACRCESP